MSNSEYVLEAVNLTKTFPGVKALDQVSLRVRPGTVHALMGENGAGKSTLMKCIYGIYSPDEGSISINGKQVSITSPRNAMDQGIAMIHQELHPVRPQTVAENIFLGRIPYKKVAGASGYQIAYSLYKNKGYRYVTVGNSRLSTTIRNLVSKKNYFVKVRVYRNVGKTRYYGAYSVLKNAKTK